MDQASSPSESNKRFLYAGIGGGVLVLALVGWVVWRRNRIDYSAFDSPDLPGSGRCIDPELIKKLKALRKRTGFPIFQWINSGARSPYWNRKVGGVATSAHLMPRCMAVDIDAPNKIVRDHLVYTAKELGFKRIGVAKTFVHLDVDPTKPQYVAWGYPTGTLPEVNPFV